MSVGSQFRACEYRISIRRPLKPTVETASKDLPFCPSVSMAVRAWEEPAKEETARPPPKKSLICRLSTKHAHIKAD